MKTLIRFLFVACALILIAAPPAHAQLATSNWFLNANLAGGSQNTLVTLSSMTLTQGGTMAASTVSDQRFLFVDGELMQVRSVNTTALTAVVIRGVNGTNSLPHPQFEPVWYGKLGTFDGVNGIASNVFVNETPSGQCTRSVQFSLPVITVGKTLNVHNGDISDCIVSPAVNSPTGAALLTSQWQTYNNIQTIAARPYKKLAVTVTTYTALPSDHTIGYNTNVAGTITLPALTGWVGKDYRIQLEVTGTQSLTIATSATQTINGAASIILGGLTSFGGITVYTDGLNWFGQRP